jgi:hypothetical protein
MMGAERPIIFNRLTSRDHAERVDSVTIVNDQLTLMDGELAVKIMHNQLLMYNQFASP